MNTTKSTLAELLTGGGAIDPAVPGELRRELGRFLIPLAVAAVSLAAWVAVAPLSGAIVATGKLKVELNHKTVQHKEGGIVREILVRDGELVVGGQPLIVIGDVGNDAALSLLADQLDAERVRNTRATAEAELAPGFAAPPGSESTKNAEHVARETALFAARRRTLDEHIAALESQLRDARAQAEALGRQIESTETAAKLVAEERAMNEPLVRDGFVQRARLLELQRAEADYGSRLSESHGNLALARQRAGDLQARIVQARNHYQQQATDEINESAARIREIEELTRPLRDQAERQFVRAPAEGRVMGLRVSAVGDVIEPGEPILDIVPTEEKLVIEAQIRPQDINYVQEGADADVRLSAFDSRTTPILPGTVVLVSADRFTSSESGDSWYLANVEIDAASLAAQPDVRLRAGMPAEIFVATPERSLFEYLTKPLAAFARRAMREP
jgi:HlyD family type I secretion membrane fusion protein